MDLSRVEIVIGKNSLEKLRAASVAVVGLGGVGSYVAEAMTRSGVGKLLLVDFDSIASSNVNRQIPALDSTIGLSKTEVLKKRLLEINRDVRIEIYNSRYNPGDFKKVFTEQYSYIVDAIDAVDAKADLIFQAVNNKIPIISAMGTGNKLDPALLRVADISATHTCPLARAVRSKLRQKGLVRGVKVVFSLEKPQKAQLSDVPGSLIFVPASAGLLMGSVIVREIIDND
ncbi:MAG: tRNA threonylcarbamoyladenosine dehydratase [Acholeplasmataceae bacterium]|nr:tRNA threonylcarbamoyladenosine dehydratase [Acholeplasmataceae bacterium]